MYIHKIDIAHPPLSSDAAEEMLDEEIRQIRFSKEYRVLKVIHGHGTDETPCLLKQVVHNWTYRNRTRIREVISGEDYDMFNPTTQEMRKTCGQVMDSDLDKLNPGITLIWIK